MVIRSSSGEMICENCIRSSYEIVNLQPTENQTRSSMMQIMLHHEQSCRMPVVTAVETAREHARICAEFARDAKDDAAKAEAEGREPTPELARWIASTSEMAAAADAAYQAAVDAADFIVIRKSN